jgi:hypothetical protein
MIPRVDWGTTDTFTFSLPARPWAPRTRTIGADDIAASGIPEAFVVRVDRIRRMTLRFTEAEWVSGVEPWLNYARGSGQPFVFAFDGTREESESTVYLEAPRISDGDMEPTRDPDFRWVLEIDISLRTESGGQFPGLWDIDEEGES